MRVLFGLLVATALGAGALSAQSLRPEGGVINEALRPSAEISGAVIAGLQMHEKPAEAVGFSAYWPGSLGKDQEFCVRVVSANGLYDAESEYSFVEDETADAKGDGETADVMVEVFYPTKHEPFLKDLKDREVAASISLGPCATRSHSLIVASWAATPDDTVTLLVNSFRADTVLARLENIEQTVRCQPIEVEVRSAYDTECSLDLGSRTGPVGLEIFRFVNRQPAPVTKIKLLLPGG